MSYAVYTLYLSRIPGKQVDVPALQTFLKTTIGLDVPLYALDQIIPSLAKDGYVEYNKIAKVYFAKTFEASFDIVKSEIETDFDQVIGQLSAYAGSVGFTLVPPSGTWGDVLITFLKSTSEKSASPVTKIKGALLDPMQVENAIVGAFIRNLYNTNYQSFEKLLRIFMGVLVEEFISSVAEVGIIGKTAPLVAFYDTGVLLRVLGCSGKMLRIATVELTRYLQDLGIRIYYLAGNEAEVSNILTTIIHVKDTGGELEGETAAAVSDGEVTITQLRMLQNAFPEQLARMNIFAAGELEGSALSLAAYQIDERAFAQFLLTEANRAKRAYGAQNRNNDAGFMGTVMRLRRNVKTRDLAECRFLFVTVNRVLAATSRRFLVQQKVLQYQHCAPVLSVGQVATIAWLLKDQSLAPDKAGRELLSNCFAAVRPDAEWFRYFREGMEAHVGSLDVFVQDTTNSITLQAARRLAQEESFGNASLVRELNMVEILERAREETVAFVAEKERDAHQAIEATVEQGKLAVQEVKIESKKLLERERELREKAVIDAAKIARDELMAEMAEANRHRAFRWAGGIVNVVKIICVIAFIALSIFGMEKEGDRTYGLYIVTSMLAVISVFSFMDLIGIPVGKRAFGALEERVAKFMIATFLS